MAEPIEAEAKSNGPSDSGSNKSGTDGSDTAAAAASGDSPVEAVVHDPGTLEIEAPPTNSGFVHSETETFTDIRKADLETNAYVGEPEDREVAYTYASHMDPNRQVDPHGIYLDDIEREKAELVRARIEDREPDFDNPPAVCSTPLIPTLVAQAQALPGVIAPVSGYETVNVGSLPDEDYES